MMSKHSLFPWAMRAWLLMGACLLVSSVAMAATQPDQGDALADKGNYAAAVKAFAAAHQKSPNDAAIVAKLAQASLRAGQHEQAVEWAKKAVALDPDNADYRLLLGDVYAVYVHDVSVFSKLGIVHKIRDAYKQAVAVGPDNAQAHMMLALFYVRAPAFVGGNTDKGHAQLRKLAKLDPVLADIAKARLAAHDEQYTKAENLLRKAIKASHGQRGYMKLGHLMATQKHPEQAVAAYRKAIAAHPEKADAYYQIGKLAALGKIDPEVGIKALETYVDMSIDWSNGDPPFCWAHYRLAQIYARQGDKGKARAEYQQALALNPHFEKARQALTKLEAG